MSGRPIIRAFFDEPTNTVSYLVTDPATNKAAVIDPCSTTTTMRARSTLDRRRPCSRRPRRRARGSNGRWRRTRTPTISRVPRS